MSTRGASEGDTVELRYHSVLFDGARRVSGTVESIDVGGVILLDDGTRVTPDGSVYVPRAESPTGAWKIGDGASVRRRR